MKVIKSNKTITSFAGISFVKDSFKTSGLTNLIDSILGKRVKTIGYQYSNIFKNLTNFYIRANKSTNIFEQIKDIENWQDIELNYKKYQVASIPFQQFYQERNYRLVIMREKSNSAQIDLFTKDTMKYRTILTNDWDSTEKQVIEYYNQRGKSEKVFDVMNNDFGWKRLPFSFLNQNNTFMIITAMIKNFYSYFITIVA